MVHSTVIYYNKMQRKLPPTIWHLKCVNITFTADTNSTQRHRAVEIEYNNILFSDFHLVEVLGYEKHAADECMYCVV